MIHVVEDRESTAVRENCTVRLPPFRFITTSRCRLHRGIRAGVNQGDNLGKEALACTRLGCVDERKRHVAGNRTTNDGSEK
jgi:hypothetical protein